MDWRSGAALVVAAACGACAADDAETVAVPDLPAALCPPGELEFDGRCLPPGEQENGCQAGELLTDGECVPAGVPPEACAPGFVADGDRGCAAVLPDEACPPGQIAVPGDRSCRAIADCGADTWAGIPVGPNTEYVDLGFVGVSDGSAAAPWTTIAQAVAAAAPGAVVAIAAGDYAEEIVVDRPVALWGRCPAEVSITGATQAALHITAAGVEIHTLALTGGAEGMLVEGDARAEALWIHDTGGYGARVHGSRARLEIAASLVEHATERGLYAEGAELVVDACAVRDTATSATESAGRGVNVRDDLASGARGTLTMTGSLVEQSREVGVMVHVSDAVIDASVIRDTTPSAVGRFGRCIAVQTQAPAAALAHLDLRRSLVTRCRDAGVFGHAASVHLLHTTIREIDVAPDTGIRGYGVAVQHDANDVPSDLEVRASLVVRASETGIFVGGSTAELAGVRILDTRGRVDGLTGRGVSAQHGEHTLDCNLTMIGSSIELAREVGFYARGAHAVVDGLLVIDTRPTTLGWGFGRGFNLEHHGPSGTRGDALVRSSRVERNHDVGIFAMSTDVVVEATAVTDTLADVATGNNGQALVLDHKLAEPTPSCIVRGSAFLRSRVTGVITTGELLLDGVAVRDTLPSLADDYFGDGVGVLSAEGVAHADIVKSEVTGNVRAGLVAFGGDVRLGASAVQCNAMALVGQTFAGNVFALHDDGGNDCSCNGSDTVCKVLTADIDPPVPPGGLP
jgi:uncharacterized protein DUF1565